MKTRSLLAFTILIIMFLLLPAPVPVDATPPEEGFQITADLVVSQYEPSASGTFTISSSFFPNDSGTVYETFVIDPEDMTVHGVKTMQGANGTIVIKFHGNITADGVIGKFVVISGTGNYRKLHGVGETWALMNYGTFPPTIYATYNGKAHID